MYLRLVFPAPIIYERVPPARHWGTKIIDSQIYIPRATVLVPFFLGEESNTTVHANTFGIVHPSYFRYFLLTPRHREIINLVAA